MNSTMNRTNSKGFARMATSQYMGLLGGLFLLAALGCGKTEGPAPTRVAPPMASSTSSAAAAPATSAAAAPATTKSFAVAEEGTATFLIDAPLEKIKGTATRYRGNLQLDPDKLSATRGQIDVDLKTLKTTTFDDAGKNTKQTEHAHNWFEIGADVDAKQREENQWVRFTIKSVKPTGPEKLAEVKEADGARTVEVMADGDFWLHGATQSKTVKLSVSFRGPPEAPTEIRIKTMEPMLVSLKAHDVKPRDVAGKFLQGVLEQVGEKIDDKVQVSLDFKVTPKAP
jgi:hypothetical protein